MREVPRRGETAAATAAATAATTATATATAPHAPDGDVPGLLLVRGELGRREPSLVQQPAGVLPLLLGELAAGQRALETRVVVPVHARQGLARQLAVDPQDVPQLVLLVPRLALPVLALGVGVHGRLDGLAAFGQPRDHRPVVRRLAAPVHLEQVHLLRQQQLHLLEVPGHRRLHERGVLAGRHGVEKAGGCR